MSPTLPPSPPGAHIGAQPVAIYLAARFARRDEMRSVARELERQGYSVTSRWLTSQASLGSADLAGDGRAAEVAVMDFDDLRRAGICIAFTEPPEATSPGRGGRHAEFGIALAYGLRVLVVGPREHVFHCLPTIEHYSCWADARSALLTARAVVAA